MAPYYEVQRPVSRKDLDGAGRGIRPILESLPTSGYVDAGRLAARTGDRRAAERAIKWACSRGVMREASPGRRVMGMESARFWLGQLGPSKLKNVGGAKGKGGKGGHQAGVRG